jgi:hypothetical protein
MISFVIMHGMPQPAWPSEPLAERRERPTLESA